VPKNQSSVNKTKTVSHVIKNNAVKHPSKHFLEDARSERFISYSQLEKVAISWRYYVSDKITPERRAVILDIDDPITFGAVYISLVVAGVKVVPVNPERPKGELERAIDLLDEQLVFIVSDRTCGGITPNDLSFVKVELGKAMAPKSKSRPSKGKDYSGSLIMFTSGSSGRPKGVELRESQLLYVASRIVEHNRMTADDIGYNPLPLFHTNAEVVGVMSTLVSGSTLVLDKKFHKTDFWKLLGEKKVTWFNSVPAILAILARSDEIKIPPSLRFIRSASAPLPNIVRDAFSDIELVVSYGMTESSSQITATPLGAARRPGSAGKPIGVQLEIRDDNLRKIPPGKIGVIWIKGPGVITQYLFGYAPGNFDENDWLNTGDVGMVDSDGYVYLLSRADDVINRGGEKFFPYEIEDVLLKNNNVLEAVVVSKADPIFGQVPIAYVIPTSNLSEDETDDLQKQLNKSCKDNLAHFKNPSEIFVVKDLPRAATGKIRRAKVRMITANESAMDWA